MTIRLPPDLEKAIRERVASGAFESADAVVTAALESFFYVEVANPQELQKSLEASVQSAEEQGTISLQDFDAAFRARHGIPHYIHADCCGRRRGDLRST